MPAEHDLDPPAMTEDERLAKRRYQAGHAFEQMPGPLNKPCVTIPCPDVEEVTISFIVWTPEQQAAYYANHESIFDAGSCGDPTCPCQCDDPVNPA